MLGRYAVLYLALMMQGQPLWSQPLTHYVNPLIGTAAGGNTHPGATTPWGLIALSPHTDERAWSNMGYRFENRYIIGFVHNQVSGIGSGEYGNFLVMPARNTVDLSEFGYKSERTEEYAYAGYYTTRLTAPQVKVELTARARTAHHRYTFAAGKKGDTLRLIFNAAHASYPQHALESKASIEANGQVVHLSGQFVGGFGSNPPDFIAYFTAKTSEPPLSYAIWKNAQPIAHAESTTVGENEACGVVLNFLSEGHEKTIELVAALSYRSAQNADAYLAEFEHLHQSFDAVRAQTQEEWNRLLSRIEIEGAGDEEKIIFYTALYHALLMPTDISGETPEGLSANAKAFTNYFAIWDSYRTLHPLLTLLFPAVQQEMLQALLDLAEYYGWLPDGFTGNAFTVMQGGTNADVLFADAAAKRLPGVDLARAYRYLLKNATIAGDAPVSSGLTAHKGRYPEYLQKGWLSCDKQWLSVSKSLEYAYNDYCVWVVGNYLKRGNEANVFKQRSQRIFELFDAQTGFFRPKKSNGKWDEPFDPARVFPPATAWSAEVHYYEGSAWQYLGYVPHDFYGLIKRLGGNKAFLAKWDTLFAYRDMDFTKGYFSLSNEPCMLAPFQYLYAGRGDRTQFWTRQLIAENFKATPDGVPGNDDSGTLSAWLVWAAIGIFPNAGQDWYFVASPCFKKVTVHLENGQRLIINAPKTSDKNRYIKSLKLNGKHLNRLWLRHSELIQGAQLDVEMTDQPTRFGSTNVPPSPFGKP